MTPAPRDGIWLANGLSADFRFIRCTPNIPNHSYIETATGEHWAHDSELFYDPPREQADAKGASIETHMATKYPDLM